MRALGVPVTRRGSLVALALALSGPACSLLAPSDDELLGGPAPGSGGAPPMASSSSSFAASSSDSSGPGGAAGASAGGAGTGGQPPLGFCASRDARAPENRFCQDFDVGDGNLNASTWTTLPYAPIGAATLIEDPVSSAPRAVRIDLLEPPTSCSTTRLGRTLLGTAADSGAVPGRLRYRVTARLPRDLFWGQTRSEECTIFLALWNNGTRVGIEFQWNDPDFKSAYVQYPTEVSILNTLTDLDFTLDFTTRAISFSINGKPGVPLVPLDIPTACGSALVATTFYVGPTCYGMPLSAVFDDIVFGTD